jgi:hypothetical protein
MDKKLSTLSANGSSPFMRRKRVIFGLWVLGKGKNGTIRGPWEHLEVQIRLPVVFGGGWL